MKTKIISGGAIAIAIGGLMAVSVFAAPNDKAMSTSTRDRAEQKEEKKMDNMQNRGVNEINKRVEGLTNLVTRIDGMKNVSDTTKASLKTSLQSLITTLNTLKDKINNDTASSTLKADVESITGAYRVYALVMPQTNILSAADRVKTITSMLTSVATKVDARITAMGTTTDANIQSALADMRAKITDANTQADAAVTAVSALVPDNGDKTKMDANKSALKDARAKIQTATKDINQARKDVKTIIDIFVKSDKAIMKTVTATSTTSTSTSTATTTSH